MAKSKVNTDFSSSSWSFLNKRLEEIRKEVNADIDKGLEAATDYLADRLQQETPVETGITKQSWVKTIKYRGVKYINNSATNKRGIPIINLLEYSIKKGKPFVRRVLKESEGTLAQIIENSIRGD